MPDVLHVAPQRDLVDRGGATIPLDVQPTAVITATACGHVLNQDGGGS